MFHKTIFFLFLFVSVSFCDISSDIAKQQIKHYSVQLKKAKQDKNSKKAKYLQSIIETQKQVIKLENQ